MTTAPSPSTLEKLSQIVLRKEDFARLPIPDPAMEH
jgi:hypothetical protein